MSFRFALAMLIPLYVCFYTVQFGRWLHKGGRFQGAFSVYFLAVITLAVSGAVLWRLFI